MEYHHVNGCVHDDGRDRRLQGHGLVGLRGTTDSKGQRRKYKVVTMRQGFIQFMAS